MSLQIIINIMFYAWIAYILLF